MKTNLTKKIMRKEQNLEEGTDGREGGEWRERLHRRAKQGFSGEDRLLLLSHQAGNGHSQRPEQTGIVGVT